MFVVVGLPVVPGPSAEVTVIYASICLTTGSLWGRAVWGIWWTWDARLTSMLLLWLL